MLRGSYDNNVLKNILITKDTSSVRHSQRGHQFMLQTQSYKTRFRKNYFSHRITNIWNNLPKHVVEATSVNSFKNLVFKRYLQDYGYSSNIYMIFYKLKILWSYLAKVSMYSDKIFIPHKLTTKQTKSFLCHNILLNINIMFK